MEGFQQLGRGREQGGTSWELLRGSVAVEGLQVVSQGKQDAEEKAQRVPQARPLVLRESE